MSGKAKGGQNGFTYLSVLFMTTVLALAAGAAGKFWSFEIKREKEDELIFRGRQIRAAIERYYFESHGAKSYPKRLEDLIDDRRYPVQKRYLRKIYADPVTGKPDWEILKSPDGGIMGVSSSSEDGPIRKKNFPADCKSFENRNSYSEWLFVFIPQNVNIIKTEQNQNGEI